MWLLLIMNLVGKVAALLLACSAPGPAVALWFVPDFLLGYHVFAHRAQGLVRSTRRFTTAQREVWLTIDDGPDPADTPRLLALLARHDAHATFFVIGQNAAEHPELIRAIASAGHEVAHHTQSHPLAWFWCASPRSVRHELDAALAMLETTGVRPTRFRSPAGIKNPWLSRALRDRGLTCIGWSARGLERWHSAPKPVAAQVLRSVRPGAILLLHEGPRVPKAIRVEAIRLVLERLDRHGFRCVVPKPEQLITP